MTKQVLWYIGMSLTGIAALVRLVTSYDPFWNDTLQSVQILGIYLALISYGHPVVDKVDKEVKDEVTGE